jgi:diguanylate cyclase (GGDEF)-like protein
VCLLRNVTILMFTCFLSVLPASAAGTLRPVDVLLSKETSSYRVSDFRYTISAPEVSIDDVMASKATAQWPLYTSSIGRRLESDEVLWVSFSVAAEDLAGDDWWLRVRLGTLQEAKLYTFNSVTQEFGESRAVGLHHPVEQRYKSSRHLALPLEHQGQQLLQVFLAIQSPNLVALPLEIVSGPKLDSDVNIELLVLAMVLGAVVVMSLYNLMLYLVLKDRAYLFYCTYVGYAALFLAGATGIGAYYFWPNQRWMLDHGTLTFASLAFLSAVLFVRKFLELHRYGKFLLHINSALQVVWVLLALSFMFSNSTLQFNAIGVMAIVTSVIGFATALYLSVKKSIAAMIFSVAWGALFFGTLVFSLMLAGVLPFNLFTAYAQVFGMVTELILLSFALAHRIRQNQRNTETAQAEALNMAVRVIQERSQRLDAQKQMLDLQQGLNEQLETQVALRTKQYEEAMDQLEEANDNLLRLSLTDSLSKVSNRRFFDESVVKECRRAYRMQQPVAIVFMDIDHFKAINDTYGHRTGDHCIRRVAEALNRIVSRAGDILARYGGEEFVYVLPGTSQEQALAVAEKSRALVESLAIVDGEIEVFLTISVGVAAWVPESEDDHIALIATADSALYQAKAKGRNRVEVLSRSYCNATAAQ